ncbi:hypothetical protein CHS0354_036485 [Potamilus streckersoni]|uniref:Uncharacterized protein n=1 Tax=Potamilus streckersoni TaxID=2493646 RepID=A0AAE0S422_9BIVA|nr:hypothetical protein CHS0354_036485 [Potamilus streckersoni]
MSRIEFRLCITGHVPRKEMSQGGNFIQNNLDDSDGETPVENQQPTNIYPEGILIGLPNETLLQDPDNGTIMAAPFFCVEPERPTGYLDRETDTEDECDEEPCQLHYEFNEPLGYADVDPKRLEKLKREYEKAGKVPDDFFKKVDEILGKGKYAPGEHPFEIFMKNNNEQKKKGGGAKIDLNDSRPLADLTGHGNRRGYSLEQEAK